MTATNQPHWICETCGTHYRFRYTPGVIVSVPLHMPNTSCVKKFAGMVPCQGHIIAANDAARAVEAHVATNAMNHKSLIDEDEDEET